MIALSVSGETSDVSAGHDINVGLPIMGRSREDVVFYREPAKKSDRDPDRNKNAAAASLTRRADHGQQDKAHGRNASRRKG